ncbi:MULTISPECIES: MarR family winged helix-turn-helix transcriptional regulator [unclassified Lentimicrobium]|uniref:MarR family winged helix-turn-helix transcriptional regulator n=1 Tax=unclassified Lentimicrobium TaxID=2677434 RepID=UPI001554F1A4|nr:MULTISPECIES: MarR family transcriptional regulator [unclassified Lentimicrobium]NPD46835.1 MarR family transcriptional regulator [Lentimicrobium sp. S6]NPD85123.1 MarR family transcriptional regulator [Lentimicrobium sp. L6]
MADSTILELIYELKKKCIQGDEAFFHSLDISQAEYNMFLCLRDCTHFNSYSVAEKMQLSLSRVSRIIDKMVNKEYLTRSTNKTDRRAIDIKMTPLGKEIMNKILEYRLDRETTLCEKIATKDVETIKSSLNKLIEAV